MGSRRDQPSDLGTPAPHDDASMTPSIYLSICWGTHLRHADALVSPRSIAPSIDAAWRMRAGIDTATARDARVERLLLRDQDREP
jgi:hypothetical protein